MSHIQLETSFGRARLPPSRCLDACTYFAAQRELRPPDTGLSPKNCFIAVPFTADSFSWADKISRSVSSQPIQPSVIETPYCSLERSEVRLWFPGFKLLSSISPTI